MLVSQMRIIYLHCDTALIPKKVSKELVKGVMFCQSNCWPKIIRPLLIFFKPWYTRPLTVCFKLLFSSQFNGFYEENTDICVNEIQKKNTVEIIHLHLTSFYSQNKKTNQDLLRRFLSYSIRKFLWTPDTNTQLKTGHFFMIINTSCLNTKVFLNNE